MNIKAKFSKKSVLLIILLPLTLIFQSCGHNKKAGAKVDKPEYFLLRPEVEKAFGYSQSVKIGNSIKISRCVSMGDEGNPTAIGDFKQQMINCYADLEKILNHFDSSFDDVVVENIFTTNMPLFLEHAVYRNEIYKNHYPTGSWLGVNALAIPEFMIEIELEVHVAEYMLQNRINA